MCCLDGPKDIITVMKCTIPPTPGTNEDEGFSPNAEPLLLGGLTDLNHSANPGSRPKRLLDLWNSVL
jgi:hypothetical protein